jgi:hypothetical protein
VRETQKGEGAEERRILRPSLLGFVTVPVLLPCAVKCTEYPCDHLAKARFCFDRGRI